MTNSTYIPLTDAFAFENVVISLSGHNSRMMPKLSYNLKLKNDYLYGYKHIKLRALFLDPSYLREQIAHNFLKSIGLISSKFPFIHLFMNDQELGLFGLFNTFRWSI